MRVSWLLLHPSKRYDADIQVNMKIIFSNARIITLILIFIKKTMTNDNHSYFLFYATHISHIQVGIHRTMPKLERNIPDQEKFINHISQHYDELKNKYRTFCTLNNYQWDEDIFEDTILKCYEAIQRKGKLNDTTPYGMESYFFISFKLNLKREGQYARNMHRVIMDDDDFFKAFSEYTESKGTEHDKLRHDLYVDFACMYIVHLVEENFTSDHTYLFKLKTLCGYTYKQLQEKTRIKGARNMVIEVMNWLKANVTVKLVNDAFSDVFGDIFND